ncbi:MAG: DUF2231 domain-containing protein [Gemmatimonadales bacterium]
MLGYDAPRWHALLNDLPAALLLLAVLFDLGSAIWKRESLKWAGIWTLWAGVIGGWAAVITGNLAEETIDHGEAIHQIMERHEQMALITMGVFTVILGWKMLRRFAMPVQEEAITRFLGIVGAAGLLWVGTLGGRMVFEHAAGISNERIRAELIDRGALSDTADTAGGHPHAPGTPPHEH